MSDRSNVLVTGGAGHIGSHLVEVLLARGHRVTVVDDLSTGSLENLASVSGRIEFVCCDVRNELRVDRLVGSADVVFHLAAAVGVSQVLDDPTAAVATNVDGTRSIVDACVRHGVRLVFASTSEVYGKTATLPMHEDDELVIGGPQSPRWSYALSKALDEHLVLEAGRAGLPVTVLRYFNSYGPRASLGGDGSVVARFVKQALAGGPVTVHGAGDQVRCFTYVADVAEATAVAGFHPAMVGALCNVGSSVPVTVSGLADLVTRASGRDTAVACVDPRDRYGAGFDETHARVPNVGRIHRLCGWAPQVGLEEGLAATVAWYSAQQEQRSTGWWRLPA